MFCSDRFSGCLGGILPDEEVGGSVPGSKIRAVFLGGCMSVLLAGTMASRMAIDVGVDNNINKEGGAFLFVMCRKNVKVYDG